MQKVKANIFDGLHDPILANYMHNYVPSEIKFLGVRFSIVKQVSLDIMPSYRVLSTIPLSTYVEHDVLYGYVLNRLGVEKNSMFYQYLHQYCGKINYYLTCDLFVANIEFKEHELPNLKKTILVLLRSNHQYKVRCGLLLLRKYFMKSNYQEVIKLIISVHLNAHHINLLKTNILFQIACKDLNFYCNNLSKILKHSKNLYLTSKEKIKKSSYFSETEKASLKGL